MTTFPSFESYRDLSQRFDIVPVYRRLLSDHLTPVSAFRLLDDGTSSAGLFESVIGGEKIGRYSFIAVGPRARVVAYGSEVSFHRDGTIEKFQCDDPLEFLSQQLGDQSIAPVPELPPFVGGAIGYASYDVVRYVENLPNPPLDDRNLPDLDFGFYDQLVIFDHVNKTIMVVVLSHSANAQHAPEKQAHEKQAPEEAYAEASRWIDRIVERLDRPLPQHSLADIPLTYTPTLKPKSNFSKEGFESAVEKCRQYIEAGDIFQVVLSQRFEIDCDSEPIEIFRTLRVINPSPFMFLLRTPECTLVGSSPEVMARVVDRVVTVRPLAGTRPRGKTSEDDRRLSDELLADPKERAEHVMLVDLGRNDVGRVAQFGSVRLNDLMVVELYSHVMHISSNVQGTLREDLTAMDAFRACLPAGTVSGAPKVRAMEIIDELEPTKRGPYAGAVGYFDYRGNMDTCITLRTMVIQNQRVYIQAGAGLVADSDPTSEYQETINKANALLAAVEVTRLRTSHAQDR
ncbi:MAG: anthranilate synthase component I [Planctomycetota bacterium]|nr:anthranilate synthase component I [Planctomycetota bacterium]